MGTSLVHFGRETCYSLGLKMKNDGNIKGGEFFFLKICFSERQSNRTKSFICWFIPSNTWGRAEVWSQEPHLEPLRGWLELRAIICCLSKCVSRKPSPLALRLEPGILIGYVGPASSSLACNTSTSAPGLVNTEATRDETGCKVIVL